MADILYIKVSGTFRCAECNARLLEVREVLGHACHDVRCPRCDRDLLNQDTKGKEVRCG